MMKTKNATRRYTVTEARDNFKDVVDGVVYTRQPAIVTKHGSEAVAVVPFELLELMARVEDLLDVHKARNALEDFDAKGGVPLTKLKKELGLK